MPPPEAPLRDEIRRRLVRFGDQFTSDELEHGDVELEAVAANPDPPPEDEQAEPWGLSDDAPEHKKQLFHGRLLDYVRHHGGGS
jgi:hypothetical protein